MLVENGIDATYSSALNFMLLAAILEATSKGISKKTKNLIWNFAHDEKTMDELNLQDFVATFEEKIRLAKAKDYVS
jgi:hypothetical protein